MYKKIEIPYIFRIAEEYGKKTSRRYRVFTDRRLPDEEKNTIKAMSKENFMEYVKLNDWSVTELS
jgi:hypothetical protein